RPSAYATSCTTPTGDFWRLSGKPRRSGGVGTSGRLPSSRRGASRRRRASSPAEPREGRQKLAHGAQPATQRKVAFGQRVRRRDSRAEREPGKRALGGPRAAAIRQQSHLNGQKQALVGAWSVQNLHAPV